MRLAFIISFVLILAMVGVSLFGMMTIPADQLMARHWTSSGLADGFSPRNHVLIGLPALGVVLTAIFGATPFLDPRAKNIEKSLGLLYTSWLGSLALLLIVHGSIVWTASNGDVDASPNTAAIGLYGGCLLLMAIGNFMSKSKSNFFVGVRTPWTLSSEHAWNMSNRACGWGFVLTGLLAAGAGLLSETQNGFLILLAGAIASAVLGVAVSYFAWRSDPHRSA